MGWRTPLKYAAVVSGISVLLFSAMAAYADLTTITSTRARFALYEAALDWCSSQSGEFHIDEDVDWPSCTIYEAGRVYIGVFGALLAWAGDALWWEYRSHSSGLDVDMGLLWYVDHRLECVSANAAVNNPARIPVVLIGPAAEACASMQ